MRSAIPRGVENLQRPCRVRIMRAERISDTPGHRAECGQMNDCITIFRSPQERSIIQDASLNDFHLNTLEVVSISRGEIIKNPDVVDLRLRHQSTTQVRTNKTGSTGHEDLHSCFPFISE